MSNQFDQFNQEELLAYIEGELSSSSATALEQRLAEKPDVEQAVNAMREQRSFLRALPTPELDVDLVAEVVDDTESDLEPMIARPMLMDEVTPVAPGAYRRQRNRALRRQKLLRMGAIAAVVALCIVGVWGAWIALGPTLSENSDSDQPMLVRNDSGGNTIITAVEPDQLGGGAIHHRLPTDLPITDAVRQNDTNPRSRVAAAEQPVPVRMALHVTAVDAASIEQLLASTVEAESDVAALVRNFSFAEAEQIAARLRDANPNRSRNQPPLVTGTDSVPVRPRANYRSLADDIRRQMRAVSADDSIAASGRIAGKGDDGPSLEQQLAFSNRGAAYTLAVPVAQLQSILAALQSGEQAAVCQLRSFEPSLMTEVVSDEATPATSDWIADLVALREMLFELEQQSPDALLLLPIVVE